MGGHNFLLVYLAIDVMLLQGDDDDVVDATVLTDDDDDDVTLIDADAVDVTFDVVTVGVSCALIFSVGA